ncbi:gephyrin-like molybdotransferase Glp [Marinicella sediminis]|uniref:Molybdopterin molybdenumtransferase n=1 Tax=Marinicella sediminis TaxID=1792834 RepID=A0ABV7J6T5_9GAMM|nr:gephyrin-like molybdotransferase Glp [Marinicella sediminis]
MKSVSFSQAIKSVTTVAAAHSLNEETVSLSCATGRYLVSDVKALVDVPATDCSRMDGYAINHQFYRSQQGASMALGTAIHAGDKSPDQDCSQLAIPVMTGALLPPGTDTVVMKEHCLVQGATITIDHPVNKGDHLRKQGSDLRTGKRIIQAPRRLTPADLGLLASAGHHEVLVRARPQVALMMSGDELLQPGQSLSPGMAYDANTPMLKALLEEMGCSVTLLPCLKDDSAAVNKQLSELETAEYDLIITVGGVSMGDRDFLPEALQNLGSIVFHKANIKPGFPVLFGQLHSAIFYGLPGNPVSAFSCLLELVYPALKILNGHSTGNLMSWPALTTQEIHKSHMRREFMRGRYTLGASGQLEVTVCGSQASSRIGSLAEANCLLVINESQQDLKEGSQVMIHPFIQIPAG